MNMNCPHCHDEYQTTFQRITGFTKSIKSAYEIYYQTCPHCDKPIVGMYEHPVPGYEFDFEKRKKLIKFMEHQCSKSSSKLHKSGLKEMGN